MQTPTLGVVSDVLLIKDLRRSGVHLVLIRDLRENPQVNFGFRRGHLLVGRRFFADRKSNVHKNKKPAQARAGDTSSPQTRYHFTEHLSQVIFLTATHQRRHPERRSAKDLLFLLRFSFLFYSLNSFLSDSASLR